MSSLRFRYDKEDTGRQVQTRHVVLAVFLGLVMALPGLIVPFSPLSPNPFRSWLGVVGAVARLPGILLTGVLHIRFKNETLDLLSEFFLSVVAYAGISFVVSCFFSHREPK